MAFVVGRQKSGGSRSPIRVLNPAGHRIRWSPELVAIPIVIGIVLGMAFGVGPVESASTVAALLVAVVMPHAGLAILAFMAPLVPPAGIPPPGFDVVLVGAVLLGCVYRLPIDRPHLRFGAPVLLVIAFTLFITVQQSPELLAGYGSDADRAVGYLYVQFLAAVGTMVAAAFLLRDRSPFFVVGLALAGAVVVGCIAVASNGAPSVPPPLGNLVAPSDNLGRASGAFRNPNYLGTYVGLMLVSAVWLLMTARSATLRALLTAVAVVLSATLVLSLSRGAVIATLVGLAVLLLARGRVLALAFLVGGVVAAVLAFPLFVQWRLETLVGSATPDAYLQMSLSDGGRLTGLVTAPALFLMSPIAGIGFGHFVPDSLMVSGTSTPINAHNWYLTVMAEQGLVGIVLVGLAAIATICALHAHPQAHEPWRSAILGTLGTSCLFLEPPTSFQLLAAPTIILVAALVADWRATPSIRGPSNDRLPRPWLEVRLTCAASPASRRATGFASRIRPSWNGCSKPWPTAVRTTSSCSATARRCSAPRACRSSTSRAAASR